jgi:hypothetical protein
MSGGAAVPGLPMSTVAHILCRMKNITLKVDEKVLAQVRRYAAAQGTSVNGLVRTYLAGLAEREDLAQQARERIRALSERSPARVGSATWQRDDLHER